ncbi:Protein transport protein [Actinidia chinensis var. chinensis]|uniref:Protein transport protein n=1 Tax=Actinidia chinensis var. chinensis TaxID=1590841 RepID=A0A2R6QHL0_ACTCC|nr:Protein transport protein [Actinidia chinensis var. chinensis]
MFREYFLRGSQIMGLGKVPPSWHDYHFITRILHFQDNLVELLHVVFQSLSLFLVNVEESSRKGFANHLVRVSLERYEVFVRIQMVHRINFSFIDPKLSSQFELGGDPSSYYPFHERGLGLSDQGIYGNWRTCIDVDGVNIDVQISNLLGSGFIPSSGHLVIDATYFMLGQYSDDYETCHRQIIGNSEIIQPQGQVLQEEVIWSWVGICHGMSSVIQRATGTRSR